MPIDSVHSWLLLSWRQANHAKSCHVALDQLALGGRAGFGFAIDHRQGDEIGEGERIAISFHRPRGPIYLLSKTVVAPPIQTGRRRHFRIVQIVL